MYDYDMEYIVRSLLCDEYGYTVGDQLSYSHNVKVMCQILETIARKKTEKSFSERVGIRKEIEELLQQLLEGEKVFGVDTYEWVIYTLAEVGAVRIDTTQERGVICDFKQNRRN